MFTRSESLRREANRTLKTKESTKRMIDEACAELALYNYELIEDAIVHYLNTVPTEYQKQQIAQRLLNNALQR